MTLGLAMIVRDAETTIVETLASVRDLLTTWTIIDTGSTDRTRELVAAGLEGIPGRLLESDWVSFAHNRSELMGEARGSADYLMLLDADMVVRLDAPLPELDADIYEGFIEGPGVAYTLPILVNGSRDWEYRGVAHAYLAAADDSPTVEVQLPQLRIDDRSHTTVEKLVRDLEILSAEHATNPLDARTCFYLAQTYADLGLIPEAIQTYRTRVHLSGWDEETYVARQRLGALLCEHVSFLQGAAELLAAWEMRPTRAEALRTLATVAANVADKIPLPPDRLFVRPGDYRPPAPEPRELPKLPNIRPKRRRYPKRPLTEADVTAIIVTRGNVDLAPILETLPYTDVVVWDNSQRPADYRAFGRYAAIPEARNPVIYWQDDDVVFVEHEQLLAAYEPGRLVCNMDQSWTDACGYEGIVGMQGAGSLCDSNIPAQIFKRYLDRHPYDDEFLLESDFTFGTLVPFTRVDLGYYAFPYADGPDRLYTQPGQHERKWAMINRCRELLAELEPA